jgi:hypothetical protein
MLKCLLVAIGLVAGLAGCAPSDALVARQLTIVDGAAFVQENHSRRQEIRRQLYDFENEVIASCRDWARAAKFDEDMTAAQERIRVCLDFMEEAYPRLATIELLREGLDSIDDLRQRVDEPEAPEVPAVPEATAPPTPSRAIIEP